VGVRVVFILETEIIILDILQQVLLPIRVVQVGKDHPAGLVEEQLIPIRAALAEVYRDKDSQGAIVLAVLRMAAAAVAALAELVVRAAEILQAQVVQELPTVLLEYQ
jgi:hypothetical protein